MHTDPKRNKHSHRETLRTARRNRQAERDFFAAQH